MRTFHIAFAFIALAAAFVLGGDDLLQRSFVWISSAPDDQQSHVVFRKTFDLPEALRTARLRLFADSRYMLWINGSAVLRGPCRFDPKAPTFDELDVASYLRPGANALAVWVHRYSDGQPAGQKSAAAHNGRMMFHAPGLTASLVIARPDGTVITLATDATWRACGHTRFEPSPTDRWETSWSSIPDRIDARREAGDWTSPTFDDSGWVPAIPVDGNQWGPIEPRHIPLLRESDAGPLAVVQWRGQEPNGGPTLASILPLELKAGDCLIVSLGHFSQAYSTLDFEADDGSVLTLEYGQTFRSSGNALGGSLLHINRYIAKAGRQTYVSADTFGCKFVALKVEGGNIKLFDMRMTERLYPFDVVGAFECDDALLNKLWQFGVRTIQACSEDAYVDCATRERVEWLADAVMVGHPVSDLTMAGPAVWPGGAPYWSDPRLFGSLLRHIGQSALQDGRVKAHHPSDRMDIHGYIEDYACLWIQSLRTWHDRTGDLKLVRQQWPAVTAQLRWFLDRRTERGLVEAREFVYPGNPLAYQVSESATLNAFIVRALADAAELSGKLGKPDQQRDYAAAAAALRQAIHAQLWDEAAGTYSGGIQGGQKLLATAHAAALCLYYDIVPVERREVVEEWFAANLEKESGISYPYQHAFFFEVLARMDTEAADRFALDLIRRRWAAMADGETQTTWEAFVPGEHCHEAGGVPTVYLSRHVLGVQVDGPAADRRLKIEPRLGDLKRVEGTVVTAFGPVPVRWNRSGFGGRLHFSVEIPVGVTASVALPRTSENALPIINGKSVQPFRTTPRAVFFNLSAGTYSGSL